MLLCLMHDYIYLYLFVSYTIINEGKDLIKNENYYV